MFFQGWRSYHFRVQSGCGGVVWQTLSPLETFSGAVHSKWEQLMSFFPSQENELTGASCLVQDLRPHGC